MLRLVEKLMRGPRQFRHLEPIAEFYVQRRPVPEWEDIQVKVGGRVVYRRAPVRRLLRRLSTCSTTTTEVLHDGQAVEEGASDCPAVAPGSIALHDGNTVALTEGGSASP